MSAAELDAEIIRVNREIWRLLVTSEYRDFKAWMPIGKANLMEALERRAEALWRQRHESYGSPF